ncbi:WecB/TagA/CpsF family glycosyltransferase [Patescibacteria group bacterium]|nr:WecB/TagA/CpsF family glycosyltransferase [Patescibacteria group bacterium]
MRKVVLGVNIDDISKEEALSLVSSWLTGKLETSKPATSKLVFTPGPEFLVTADKDAEFKKVLNSSDLNLPDGFGLKLLGGVEHTIAGVDFVRVLCQLAAKNGWTVGLLGGQTGIARLAAKNLQKSYPGLKVTFAFDGPAADKILTHSDTLPYSDILFVAFGHPAQEKFLAEQKASSVKRKEGRLDAKRFPLNAIPFRIGIGVGGSFDFISGTVPEPPVMLKRLGLKWLGRLLSRPAYMAPKVFRAIVSYPLLILNSRLCSR